MYKRQEGEGPEGQAKKVKSVWKEEKHRGTLRITLTDAKGNVTLDLRMKGLATNYLHRQNAKAVRSTPARAAKTKATKKLTNAAKARAAKAKAGAKGVEVVMEVVKKAKTKTVGKKKAVESSESELSEQSEP